MPGSCGLRGVSKFQGVLSIHQILVIDFNARNLTIYEGPGRNEKIVIYKQGDHFNVINLKKPPAFNGKRFFCQKGNSYYQLVLIHVVLACEITALKFHLKNVLVLTVSKFFVMLHALTIIKSLANLEGGTFVRSM